MVCVGILFYMSSDARGVSVKILTFESIKNLYDV